jgi:hypothetical protein
MAETDWFNKPVENSRELILKEAFISSEECGKSDSS